MYMRLMILTILIGSLKSEDYKGTLEGPLMRTDVRVVEGGFCFLYLMLFTVIFSFRLDWASRISQLFS